MKHTLASQWPKAGVWTWVTRQGPGQPSSFILPWTLHPPGPLCTLSFVILFTARYLLPSPTQLRGFPVPLFQTPERVFCAFIIIPYKFVSWLFLCDTACFSRSRILSRYSVHAVLDLAVVGKDGYNAPVGPQSTTVREKHCPLLYFHNLPKYLNGDSMKGGSSRFQEKFTFLSKFFFQLNLYSFFACFSGPLPSQLISEGMLGCLCTTTKKKKRLYSEFAGWGNTPS